MKKFALISFAALLVFAFTAPAMAVEHEFGGYWRTRAFTNQNFSGDDEGAQDLSMVDTRTRIYYTAILNDNLKLVNKFEFNANWGDDGYGDIGADGLSVLVKESYADFNIGSVNAKIGAHYFALGRSFLFDDSTIGATVSFNGEGFSIPVTWIKAYEGYIGDDADDYDVDYYAINPSFSLGENMTLNPFLLWVTTEDLSAWGQTFGLDVEDVTLEATDLYYVGLNFDASFDGGGVWFTGIYQTGTVDWADVEGPDSGDVDVSAYLIAAGGNINLGAADVHGQAFYATGDDDDDEDIDVFLPPKGASYYWAEIMGYGTFDEQVSAGSPADAISNIMAFNLGVSFSPMDKLTLGADLWYAAYAEDVDDEDKLGTEVDLSASYELIEGLNLDVVAAYLFADDATEADEDEADPWELGARLSLSF